MPKENNTIRGLIESMHRHARDLRNTTVEYQKSRVMGDMLENYAGLLERAVDCPKYKD